MRGQLRFRGNFGGKVKRKSSTSGIRIFIVLKIIYLHSTHTVSTEEKMSLINTEDCGEET